MLYVKKINEITFQDVQNFCNQNIKENEILEYKSDFPKNLDKVISSMANTYGGIIIIGIEDSDSFPQPPFDGIDFVSGLAERITQIDISNIYPPVFPEIQVCPPENNKTFVVIRIPESNATPHYIKQKTNAYVRTGNVSTPEKIANVNELEWLRNRRQKAINFRESILKNVDMHFRNIGRLEGLSSIPYSVFSMSICPLYPSKSIVLAQKIEDILNHTNTHPRITYSDLTNYKRLPIQSGLATFLVSQNIYDYLEINQFGLISKKRNLEWEEKRHTQEQVEDGESVHGNKISFVEIFLSILSFFEFINYFYGTIGWHGYCKLQIVVENILGISLNTHMNNATFLSEGTSIMEKYTLPEEFKVISIPKFRDLKVRENCLINISKNIAWALGSRTEQRNFTFENLKYHAEIENIKRLK